MAFVGGKFYLVLGYSINEVGTSLLTRIPVGKREVQKSEMEGGCQDTKVVFFEEEFSENRNRTLENTKGGFIQWI